MCTGVLPARACAPLDVLCLEEQGDDESPGTGVPDACGMPRARWEPNPCQPGLLTPELSLQPRDLPVPAHCLVFFFTELTPAQRPLF